MEPDRNHWLISASLVTSSILAVTANSFLLLIFCRRRSLRTVPNRFIINLLVTNLLSSLLLIPLLIADQSDHSSSSTNVTQLLGVNSTVEIDEKMIIREEIVKIRQSDDDMDEITNTTNFEIIETNEKVSSPLTTTAAMINNNSTTNEILCYSARGSTTFVCTLSILSILLIGINQYFGVIHSLRYHFYVNKFRSSMFILTTWLLALTFSVLSCLTRSDGTLWHFCHMKKSQQSEVIRIFNTIYAFSYFVVVILAPFVAICIIYVCIYTAAHKNSQRMRKSTSANLDNYLQVPNNNNNDKNKNATLPKVQSAPNFAHYEESERTATSLPPQKVQRTISERHPNFIANLKHKISNASVFKYREETRAAKISVLVIFLVLFCYVPYGLTLVLNSDLIQIDTSRHFNYLSLVLLVFSNIISPFLFAYRNKRVKREIGRIFGLVADRPANRLSILDERSRRRSTAPPTDVREPFLTVPTVIVTCKVDGERKSILKRVCTSSGWAQCKKCNFISVPDTCCISGEARGSFSSASTQISNED